jgi:hypothetical protein
VKVVNIGNIADVYICDDLPATGIVIEATIDELKRLPNLAYKEVSISATPRRNCDVGTPKEQHERHNCFCYAHRVREKGCNDCPLNGEPCCELAWAQMPYEEGDK